MSAEASWILRWHRRTGRRPSLHVTSNTLPKKLSVNDLGNGSLTVFEGYLFEKQVLQERLRLSTSSSEAQILEAAYKLWGSDLFSELRGGFIAVLWDEREQRLLIGRDAIGLHPCFYWTDDSVLIVSSSLDQILGEPEVSQDFNIAVVAEHLLGSLPTHQRTETFYKDIARLRPAHHFSITREAMHINRYWDPVPPGFEWASQEDISGFEGLLERAVQRCLSVGADSIALSGGFDSVGIAVLAADQLKGETPLNAVSLQFVNTVCDESSTQIAVARVLGMPQVIQTLEQSVGGRSALDASLEMSSTSPSPVLSVWQSFYAGLFRSAGDGAGNILLGTGGDELLTVDLKYGADCLATLQFGELWRFLRACQRSSPFSPARVARVVLWDEAIKPEGRAIASNALEQWWPAGKAWLKSIQQRRQSQLIEPDVMEVLLERRQRGRGIEMAPGERSYVAAMRNLPQAPILFHEFEQAYAWAHNLGFSLLYPYYDQDLVEVVLRFHPTQLIAGGKAKGPLRRMVGRRLPAVSLPTKKVDFAQMVHDLLRPRCKEKWQSMEGTKCLEDLGISKRSTLDAAIEDYASGRNDNAQLVWRILSTESWLRKRPSSAKTIVKP